MWTSREQDNNSGNFDIGKRSQSKIFGHVYADTSIRTRIRAFLKQRKIPLAIVAPGSLINQIFRSSRVACSDQGSGLNVAIRPGELYGFTGEVSVRTTCFPDFMEWLNEVR